MYVRPDANTSNLYYLFCVDLVISSTIPIKATTMQTEALDTTFPTVMMSTENATVRRRQKAEAYLEDLIRNYTSSPKQEAPSEPPTAEAKNAETIGSIGIIFMALFLSLLIGLDIISLPTYLQPMRDNFRQLSELLCMQKNKVEELAS